MESSVKIRILVFHDLAKFLVLIDPAKSVRELKEEILRIYSLNTGIESDVNADDLDLLAYEGFSLCNDYIVSDALYDGCLLTTSSASKDRHTSPHYRPLTSCAIPPRLPTGSNLSSSVPMLQQPRILSNHPVYVVTTQPHIRNAQHLADETSTKHLMTPSTLTDVPGSQSDNATNTLCDVDQGNSSDRPTAPVNPLRVRTVTKRSTTDRKKKVSSEVRENLDVYDFRSEDSEAPIISPSKRAKRDNNKNSCHILESHTVTKRTTKEVKTPTKGTASNTRLSQSQKQPVTVTMTTPISKVVSRKQRSTPAAQSTVSSSDLSSSEDEDFVPKSTSAKNKKCPPPKKTKAAKKTTAGKSQKLSTISEIEFSDSWSSVEENTGKEDKNNGKKNVKSTGQPTNLSTDEDNKNKKGKPEEVTKADKDTENNSQNKKAAEKEKNGVQTSESDSDESGSDTDTKDGNSPTRWINQGTNERDKSESNKEAGVSNHSSKAMSSTEPVQEPETIKIPSSDDDKENDKVEDDDKETQGVEGEKEEGMEIGGVDDSGEGGEEVTHKRSKEKSDDVPDSQELFTSEKNKDEEVSSSCDEDYSSDEVPIVGSTSVSKKGIRKKSEIAKEKSTKLANLKAASITDKKKGQREGVVSKSPKKGAQPLAEVVAHKSSRQRAKQRSLLPSAHTSVLTSPKAKSKSSKTRAASYNSGVALTLRSAKNNAVVSSSLVSSTGEKHLSDNTRGSKLSEKEHGITIRRKRDKVKKDEGSNTGPNISVVEEELSSDSDDSSSSEEESDDEVRMESKKSASKPLQALATDADATLRTVNLKSINMVPPKSNVRKKLLNKTTLTKIPLSADKNRTKSSTPFIQSRVSKPQNAKKNKVSKTRALEGISKEEEEMVLNLSQEPLNFSKIVNDETLW